METVEKRVSVLLVNYNNGTEIERCLASLLDQHYPDYEIIVVDNASQDGSAALIAAEFPQVKLIRAGENLGFGGGNNLAAAHASGQYLVFLNPDTIAEPDLLELLVFALAKDPWIGLVTPKILLVSPLGRINTCGNSVHYTGYGYLRGWMLHASEMNHEEDVFSISGAAFMMRKSLFDALGGFDTGFSPAYVEDTDLSWRAFLLGYRTVYTPFAAIYHDYTSHFSPAKYHWLERNRYQLLLKNLRWGSLFALLPALLVAEVMSWGFALRRGLGYVTGKIQAYTWILSHWRAIMGARRQVQQMRQVSDRDVLVHCDYRINFTQVSEGFVSSLAGHIFNPVFYLLYSAALLIIHW